MLLQSCSPARSAAWRKQGSKERTPTTPHPHARRAWWHNYASALKLKSPGSFLLSRWERAQEKEEMGESIGKPVKLGETGIFKGPRPMCIIALGWSVPRPLSWLTQQQDVLRTPPSPGQQWNMHLFPPPSLPDWGIQPSHPPFQCHTQALLGHSQPLFLGWVHSPVSLQATWDKKKALPRSCY